MTTITDLNLQHDLEMTRTTPLVRYRATDLTTLRHRHIGWMLTLLSDSTIAHYEPLPVPPTDTEAPEILATFIRRQSPPDRSVQGWVILENGRKVGVCQLRRSGEGHLVGVSLQPNVRNRGLGTALFKALGDWGLIDGSFVAGEVEDDNLLSHKALQSAGYTARDRYPVVLADGRHTIVTRYEGSVIDLTRTFTV
jgi:GNAT superfamily N-acetyltransferase